MKILFFNQQNDLKIHPKSVKLVVKEVLSLENSATDEVSIHFVTQEEIAQLHLEYFDDPSPTDCISFPIDANPDPIYHILGEIFVCPKIALEYTLKSGKGTIDESYLEITLYVVHGLLHLLGYDDIETTDQLRMRQEEGRLMEHLIKNNLLICARNTC